MRQNLEMAYEGGKEVETNLVKGQLIDPGTLSNVIEFNSPERTSRDSANIPLRWLLIKAMTHIK